ncbi:hypothetical protein B9Z55_009066 [Caenorhabditis nigoni]|uniref:Uncharacterized protein n=1 Tax=Caenorhabditis nigoni TaxID=1611254 RepID=A0A2G5UQJ0_9PELO|nr:hypothetical protein B9Z55_009066 [Caenorhabditis nigoni]
MPTRLTVAKPPAVVFCVNQLCQRRKCMKRYDTHQGSMSLYFFEFSGMPSIRLLTFLDAQCPGWERRPVEVVNLRLAQIGQKQFRFEHRRRGPISGVVQLLDTSCHNAWFWFSSHQKRMTVSDYFFD